MSKDQVKSLLPEMKERIDALNANGNRDGKFQFMPESYDFDMQYLLTYDEYWYRAYRSQTLIVDMETGETMEWKGEDDDLELMLNKFPQLTMTENSVETVHLGILVQGQVMYDGPNPMGIDEYPFVPVMAYYEPHIPYFSWRVQGVVRGLRDSQYLYNRRKVIELDILEAQISSGFIYKEDKP